MSILRVPMDGSVCGGGALAYERVDVSTAGIQYMDV
jgi:hypothetical protein